MNKEKFAHRSSLVLIAVFCVILALAMLSGFILTDDQYSFYENRNLAAFPELTLDGVMDGSYFTALDTYIKERSAAREGFLRLSTFIDLYLLRRPVVNDVVITRDTLLPFNDFEVVSDYNVNYYSQEIANNLKSHTDLVESYGGSFYYVAVPCQYVCKSGDYPWYLNNRSEYTEATRAALFPMLEEAGIEYIDMLRYCEENDYPDSYSSNIDNHFSITGGYATYLEIIERINSDGKFSLDPLTEGEYSYSEVEKRYLGSRTRKIFDMWDITEPIGIMTVDEDIPFTRYNWGSEGASTVYHIPGEDEQYATYGVYMGGDISETVIKTERPDLPSILVYGDSFTNAVESLIWYNFDTMYSLDLRHYDEMDLESYIEKFKPDIVVCIRDYQALLSPWYNGQ
ncbi:MAG: hypothetical protein IKC32_01755 [Clostridia bacterium]|nr:hypothetical protein [Clostridia bacterium]